MKLHLPLFLRKSVLSCIAFATVCTLSSGTLAYADNLVLGAGDKLSVDYAAVESIPDLDNGTLQLEGDTLLQLLNCGSGDGKTYTLATGVSGLLDAQGKVLELNSSNNVISNYFDATQPGTGFWAGGTLQNSDDGLMQLVLHDQTVKDAVTISSRMTSDADYRYYEGVAYSCLAGNDDEIQENGGGIYGSSIMMSYNGEILFNRNSSSLYGGSIYGSSTCSLTNNGSVLFSENAGAYGGAIYGRNVTLVANGSVEFSRNRAVSESDAFGGALESIHLTVSDNNRVIFSDNSATGQSWRACGGALSADSISMNDNGSVQFIRNYASAAEDVAYGGAVHVQWDILEMTGNAEVKFTENLAFGLHGAYGGAIYLDSSDLMLSSNREVLFSGNIVSGDQIAKGGAIYAESNLNIQNNDLVEFYRNAEVRNEQYRLRSIHSLWGNVNLSTAEGKSILFRDSIYISGGTFNLNADYTDAEGNPIKQIGDIIFTGATTVDDLYKVKGDVAGTETEIRLSRTSEVKTMTNLYGGRLRVEDGAIYQGLGITVHEGSDATVRVVDAELSHVGYDLTFLSGTTLEVSGVSTITGNVKLQNGSALVLSGSGTEIVGNASSSFLYAAGAAVSSSLSLRDYGSVSFTGNAENSESSRVDGGAIDGRFIALKNNANVLFGGNALHTNSSAFARGAFGGAIKGGEIMLTENESVIFIGNKVNSTGYSSGGALDTDTRIQISNNGEVQFVENAASGVHNVFGGAIYGFRGTTLFSDNARICFRGNSSTSSSYAYGGAIGFEGSLLDFRDNDTLQFFENKVVSTGGSAQGGAIYAESNLNIQNNDLVEFYRNAEVRNEQYRLRSIHSSWGNVNLSTAEGKSILFRDSIYIANNTSFSLNADYVDEAGQTHKQTGDIIFTGATTEADLLAVKGSAGTAQEILSSRTSEVYTMTNLCGGRLRIEDGAIYKGNGITVAEGANATLMLKNGELSHDGYDITISFGSTLSAVGENTITASTLAIQDGGTMQLALDMTRTDSAAVLTTTGNLSMGNISFNLTGTEYLVAGDYKLLSRTEGVDYDISGWTLNGVTSDQLHWENGTLYYTGGHDWNHGVTDDDDISDLEEILGNLIINGGDVTLEAVVGAIQDAVDAGFGHGQGHIVINRGGIHISGAGDLDGHIIFNGDLKDIRKLFIEKDITSIKIELGGSSKAENIMDVGDTYTVEIDELSGDGSMSKTGQGEMVVHGNGNKVGGTLDVQEGTLTFTVGNDTSGEAADTETEVHELVVGNKKDKEAKVKVDKDTKVKGNKMQVDGQHAVVTNNGTMEFTEEVKVKNGHLDNQGSISKVTLEGGKVSGSGTFAGLEMLGGELVVGNSPGLQTYTDAVELSEGIVTFSLADAGIAATADTHGWSAAAYSTIDMSGNALTIGSDVRFVLEIGGGALEALTASDDATLTFSLSLIQNIANESLTLNSEALAELLSNTSIIITSDAEGLTTSTLFLAGRDITSMLSNAEYSYEGNTLVFNGTVTNDGSLTVPEPTTATLSLLALAALATRRRRK